MIKKTITYTNYNDEEITEDFYFNLTKAELVELELVTPGGFSNYLTKLIESQDGRAIIDSFKEIIKMAYGKRSEDGRRFIKNDELFEEFAQTEAYSELFVQLATDAEKSSDFINGLVPRSLAEEAAKSAAQQRTNRPEPQDRLPKQVKEQYRSVEQVEGPVEITKTEEPELASEPVQQASTAAPEEKTHYTMQELSELGRDELQAIQARGLTGNPAEGFTVRPAHESGPGFQKA